MIAEVLGSGPRTDCLRTTLWQPECLPDIDSTVFFNGVCTALYQPQAEWFHFTHPFLRQPVAEVPAGVESAQNISSRYHCPRFQAS